MSGVEARLAAVRERIWRAAQKVHRKPEEITLLAVSKLQPADAIREAYAAGQRDFAENYAQDLRDKAAELADLNELRWHAIGPLQRNKAKYVAPVAASFHAIDRAEIAIELGRRRQGAALKGYLEINIAREPSKAGVAPEETERLLHEVRGIDGIEIVGLMCMPPPGDPQDARPHFRALRVLAERLSLPRLSMGTTEDFEIAIEEGATDVRVGRAIFGEREG